MNNIYIIHFGMGQKAIKAYECPLTVTHKLHPDTLTLVTVIHISKYNFE